MDMSGEKRINAPRARVWEALNDPESLKASIPGCDTVEKKSDTEFTAKVALAIGPVKAKFTGDVTLSDLDPPNGYTLTGQGSGGVAGFGKGEAKVSLRDDGGATIIAYQVHATVGGKLAQVGQRLIDSTAKKLADQFFEKFSRHVESGEEPAAGTASSATPAAAPAAKPAAAPVVAPPPALGGMTLWLFIIAALIALWIINH
ncbi:MAG: carbon monoxide dehydrogenase subunit G [Alphaproteobacteria bacterium]